MSSEDKRPQDDSEPPKIDTTKFLGAEARSSLERTINAFKPKLAQSLMDAIEHQNRFTAIEDQFAAMRDITPPMIATLEPIEFELDDSAQRTAEHTATMAETLSGLIGITQQLTDMTKANIEHSIEADGRNKRMSRLSLIVSCASAAAAITSAILFASTMN